MLARVGGQAGSLRKGKRLGGVVAVSEYGILREDQSEVIAPPSEIPCGEAVVVPDVRLGDRKSATEIEVKERKDRVDDALNATKAAVEEGVVSGGGTALLYATKVLKNLEGENDDQDAGVAIVRKAIQSPLRQIIENAHYQGCYQDHDFNHTNHNENKLLTIKSS